MAELDIATGKNRKEKSLHKRKKLLTKVDLTPMVDLGFLLITFFMVTSAWSKPHVTDLRMPADGDSTKIEEKVVLNVLAGRDNQIFYYNGKLNASLKEGTFGITGYSINGGVGEIIRQKQFVMDKIQNNGRKELMVIIKPSKDASYENIVSLLDEMLINKVPRYALVDITYEEQKLLDQKIPR